MTKISNEVQTKLDAVRTQPQAQVDAWKDECTEWTALVNAARDAGLSPEDVRTALRIMSADNESVAKHERANGSIQEDDEA